MKKFFITIIFGLLIGAAVLISISYYDLFVAGRRIDYSVDPQCHTICIGPSTVQTSVDDSLLVGVKNLGRSGSNYVVLTPVLEKILDCNPHIDTVFLGHGPFMAYSYSDKEYSTKELGRLRSYIAPFFHIPECRKPYLGNKNFYVTLLTPNLMHLRNTGVKTLDELEFNQAKDRTCISGLYNDSRDWGIHWYDSMYRGEFDKYSCEYIEDSNLFNMSEIDRAIFLCYEHNAVPILYFPPIFEIDRWIDRKGFREYMAKHYDHSLLVADYTDFRLPDSCYQDVHHLNIHGAVYLTHHIAREGWHLQTLEEWLVNDD